MAEYQAALFERPDDAPTHWFYLFTNMTSVKSGHAKSMDARKKGDAQFKGGMVIWKILCNCPLPPDSARHPTCVRETRWEHTHKRARLPASEWFRATPGVMAGLRMIAGDDDRAQAILDQLERNTRRVAG